MVSYQGLGFGSCKYRSQLSLFAVTRYWQLGFKKEVPLLTNCPRERVLVDFFSAAPHGSSWLLPMAISYLSKILRPRLLCGLACRAGGIFAAGKGKGGFAIAKGKGEIAHFYHTYSKRISISISRDVDSFHMFVLHKDDLRRAPWCFFPEGPLQAVLVWATSSGLQAPAGRWGWNVKWCRSSSDSSSEPGGLVENIAEDFDGLGRCTKSFACCSPYPRAHTR